MSNQKSPGLGWRRDLPDFRDLSFESNEIQGILRISAPYKSVTGAGAVLPASMDLRKWCTRVRDQGALNAGTAFSVVALTEYFDRRAFGKHENFSELFLYRSTRDLLGYREDIGAELRSTFRALQKFGLPSESLYPYDEPKQHEAPPAYCYGFVEQFRTVRYFRVDDAKASPQTVLSNVRKCLASRLPLAFGLSIYTSFPLPSEGSEIQMPDPGEQLVGGHSLVAVGYDDEKMIGGDQGALLVRNHWGTEWGDRGYAWLPYKYVETRLAADFWSFVRLDFVNTDLFN